MIKKLIAAIIIALPLCASAQKFGTINAQSVMTKMPAYTEAQKKLEDASKTYETEFSNLRTEYEKKAAELQQIIEDAATPQSIKERRVQELQELEQKINQFMQTAQQDLQRQESQLMQPIQEKMIEAINSVGKEQGFTFIFQLGVPVYQGADVVDVTPEVMKKLGL